MAALLSHSLGTMPGPWSSAPVLALDMSCPQLSLGDKEKVIKSLFPPQHNSPLEQIPVFIPYCLLVLLAPLQNS